MATGSGISGSTAWHGAFRFRQYLTSVKPTDGEQPESDLRELQFKKNQYGPLGESVVLRWRNGLFLPEPGIGGLEKIAREARTDEMFVDLLDRFAAGGRNTCEKPNAPTYAPTLFAKESEANKQGIRKVRLRSGHASAFRG